ncbi:MAG: TetR/AcrR family transcriptional regulator [Paludibacteraceae bacterium]|nr:TetR/AcrR family transcriptional regulator [Paludibacteraceae bacterium]MBN2787684.1 TetR/AcrR family transcriptional regulator [Paludibacteraceae bacterium]
MITISDKLLTTENKIIHAAKSVFLFYGYHGATLQQVADLAGVHKSAIHYYFRSKERLYENYIS